jgi:hypothetical protein
MLHVEAASTFLDLYSEGVIFLMKFALSLTNSVALVRELTTPTERPPLVGEVSANFCG